MLSFLLVLVAVHGATPGTGSTLLCNGKLDPDVCMSFSVGDCTSPWMKGIIYHTCAILCNSCEATRSTRSATTAAGTTTTSSRSSRSTTTTTTTTSSTRTRATTTSRTATTTASITTPATNSQSQLPCTGPVGCHNKQAGNPALDATSASSFSWMDQLRGDDNVVANASNSPKKIVGFNTIVALVTIAVLAGITAAAIHMAGHGRQRNRSSGLERLDGSLFFSALSFFLFTRVPPPPFFFLLLFFLLLSSSSFPVFLTWTFTNDAKLQMQSLT